MSKLDTWASDSGLVRILLLLSHMSLRKVFSSLLIISVLLRVIWPAPTTAPPCSLPLCLWPSWFSYLPALTPQWEALHYQTVFFKPTQVKQIYSQDLSEHYTSINPERRWNVVKTFCRWLAKGPNKENKTFSSLSPNLELSLPSVL